MDIKGKTDTELILLLSQDNESAFSELYVRYKDKLCFFCLSLLKSCEETNDIVQELFIRVWEMRSSLNPDLSFSSLLYTMARNRIFNHLRDLDIETKAISVLAMQKPEKEESIDSQIIYTEYQNILKAAIGLLPSQGKKVFNMSRMENMPHKEIAARLGISVYTVQEHISESLKFIRYYFIKNTDFLLYLPLLLTF